MRIFRIPFFRKLLQSVSIGLFDGGLEYKLIPAFLSFNTCTRFRSGGAAKLQLSSVILELIAVETSKSECSINLVYTFRGVPPKEIFSFFDLLIASKSNLSSTLMANYWTSKLKFCIRDNHSFRSQLNELHQGHFTGDSSLALVTFSYLPMKACTVFVV